MTEIYSWESSCISDYEPLKDNSGWEQCPNCKEFPRTWVFDNGNYARCRCQHKWDEGGASAPTIIESCCKNKVFYEEYKDYLRVAWNKRCLELLSIPEPREAE